MAALVAVAMLFCGTPGAADPRPYEGARAWVIEPENSWGWDAAIFGALHERGFDVSYVGPGALEDFASLSRCDLLASSIRRGFTAAQSANLRRFVAEGGAFYGSWGGPMATPDLLREVCRVASTRSVRISEMVLLDGTPLVRGIRDLHLQFPPTVAHAAGKTWEMVAVWPLEDGVPVARDAGGNVLGVLARHGKGRAAVLGFGPEKEKYYIRREVGPAMMDNLLAWLLEERLKSAPRPWPGVVEVALPARAELTGVRLNGTPQPAARTREFGSLRMLAVDVSGVKPGEEAMLQVAYRPMPPGRNVETIIHLPWASLPRGGPPKKLAAWLKSVNATIVQPLLREPSGHAYYRGMPDDTADPVSVMQYPGDFLAEFIEECHEAGIKVIGGVYFESRATLRKHPDAALVDRNGTKNAKQACFNNPDGQEYNLATIKHLLDSYRLDGLILDDNYELQDYGCHCPYCLSGFEDYCRRAGIGWEDPRRAIGGATAARWRDYKLAATRDLAAKVVQLAHQRRVPAGGWVGAGMASAHLGQVFDFLGGMVYREPPRAVRGLLSALGKCQLITLLWAPGEQPERIEQEARQAVLAGSATVGFWVFPPGHQGGEQFRMLPGSYEAIARALARVGGDWLGFYRTSILAGDGRFVILGGTVGRQEMSLRLKNIGAKAATRIQGQLDLRALGPRP